LQEPANPQPSPSSLPWDRIIPSNVKQAVWKRDGGKCVKCGADKNLHFDHIIPFSKGGTSLAEKNIQLLCMECNFEKSDKI
jgi:5-methylcytosine-specific restriction endonuclease McrA